MNPLGGAHGWAVWALGVFATTHDQPQPEDRRSARHFGQGAPHCPWRAVSLAVVGDRVVAKSSAGPKGALAVARERLPYYPEAMADPGARSRTVPTANTVGGGGDPRLSTADREALLEVVKDDEYGKLLDTIPITVPDLDALL